MSARAAAYQAQISGRTGEAYVVNGVKFDGVDAAGLLDAKGPGYAIGVKNGQFQSRYSGATNFLLRRSARLAQRTAPL